MGEEICQWEDSFFIAYQKQGGKKSSFLGTVCSFRCSLKKGGGVFLKIGNMI